MARDTDARLNTILQDFGPFLAGIARRLRPRGLGIPVEEIEQEVRIRLWRALEAEKEIEQPASYLYKVAATVAIDAVRRVKARREESLEAVNSVPNGEPTMDDRSSPEGLARRRETMSQIQKALGALPEERQRAVGLHLRGFTTDEVADLLGWTEPKARNLVYRGLEDLRNALRSTGIDVDNIMRAT